MTGGKELRGAVLLIGPVAPPVGGMTIVLENLMTSKLKDVYDISVLDTTGYRARAWKANLLKGISHQIYLVFRLMYLLIRKNPKIVHVNMASFFYFYRRSIDILISKLFGKKVIFHLHGASYVKFFRESPYLGKMAIRCALAISDRIVVLSKYWADFISTVADCKKIAIIPNGVKCSDFHLVNDKKNELGFSKEHILALFIGPIGRRKGSFDILDVIPVVMHKIKDISFVFCGPGEFEGEAERFVDIVQKNNLGPHVQYIAKTDGQDKCDYYMSSDIFILPSYAENLPNALLEAMAAGLPVVVSDVGAMPEIIKDGVNGFLIKAGDINAIAEKIILLARDSDLRKSMGKRNLRLVKEKYDMPIIARRIDALYEELLYGRR